MNRKILLLVVTVISLLGVTYIVNNFGSTPEIIEEKNVKYADLLNQENYDKVGINPEKYSTYEDFLKDFKTFDGVKIDPFKEDFAIIKKAEDGTDIYVPFYRSEIKKSDFSVGDLKNLAILDIYDAYKNNDLFGGYDSKQGEKIIFKEDIRHKESGMLYDVLSLKMNLYALKDELEGVKNLDTGKKQLLAYFEDLEGNYEKANSMRNDICKENKSTCDETTNFSLKGKILDSDGNPLEGARIVFLNDSSIIATSNSAGEYNFETMKLPAFSHVRFKATKLGYSDAFMNFSLNTSGYKNWESAYIENFKMNKSNANFSIDLAKERESGNKYFTVTTAQSKYFVPVDGLKHFDGKKYTGDKVDIYLYEFKKTSNIENLMNNDTFNPVYGYVGNLMKTFGMPYIQFINPDNKEELFIMSSNPMILQNQIYHMKELYENFDKIYEAITDEDMKFLVEKSNELGGFPINFEFLTGNNMLRWPAWWTLDRKKGIWHNIGSRVLDEGGLVELEFYSIKDN